MLEEKYIINGLKLPEKLVVMLRNGHWRAPDDKTGIQQVLDLPEHLKGRFDEYESYAADFEVYDFELMEREVNGMKKWPKAEWFDESGCMFLGKADSTVKPGDIDVEKSIPIADLGRGSDSPFVLDYRGSAESPTVMILRWGGDAEQDNRWMKIAESFDEFVEAIGIITSEGNTWNCYDS
ncbi:SMI1-KNR4 cell-wall [Catalinimonas alkaloidigena]|uniref:SMI1-KNR4 cell-wall n=1 Tax=Catalinimonas alkaloidigena TaxID=1075417 RepID=A0A1G9LQW6_9BACT|nr:hypothetical protein [Catalinimonas alkaloidigena]SDL63885.1 SMI1-KNR4 cell-wall [Catalinimonas alkaloidigena]